MKREFLAPKPPFHPHLVYRDCGETTWRKLADMPENEQKLIVFKLEDNFIGKRHLADARNKGAKTPIQILERVVPNIWGRLTPEYDIDNDKLNFEK